MNTSPALDTKKTPKPRKAPAKVAAVKADEEVIDRSRAAWLVRDDKLLVASLALDVFAISALLKREPISVLQRLLEPRVFDALAAKGLDFVFETDSEEKAEFYGLTLCGVPVESALRWCLANDDRPTTAKLTAMMTTADFRPAMYMARDMGICFSNIDQMDDLRSLEQDWPLEIVQAGAEDVIARFDIPTAESVLAVLNGEPQERAKPYAWLDINASTTVTRKAKGYKRKSKSSYSRSTTWKPYRKSRRTYGTKRTYA